MTMINPYADLKVGSTWVHRSRPQRRVIITSINGAWIAIRDVSVARRKVGMNTRDVDSMIAATFARCYKPEIVNGR